MSTAAGTLPRRPTRMAFFTMAEEVRAEVEAGAFLTMIYAARRERLGMSYSQFARHVQRYLGGDGRKTTQPKPGPRTAVQPTAVRPARRSREPLKLVLAPATALLDRREAADGAPMRRSTSFDDDLI